MKFIETFEFRWLDTKQKKCAGKKRDFVQSFIIMIGKLLMQLQI